MSAPPLPAGPPPPPPPSSPPPPPPSSSSSSPSPPVIAPRPTIVTRPPIPLPLNAAKKLAAVGGGSVATSAPSSSSSTFRAPVTTSHGNGIAAKIASLGASSSPPPPPPPTLAPRPNIASSSSLPPTSPAASSSSSIAGGEMKARSFPSGNTTNGVPNVATRPLSSPISSSSTSSAIAAGGPLSPSASATSSSAAAASSSNVSLSFQSRQEPIGPPSPGYWFEMFKRKRDANTFAQAFKQQLEFFGDGFLSHNQLHFQHFNLFIRENSAVHKEFISNEKKALDGKVTGGFDEFTDVLAKLNQYRVRLSTRFQSWHAAGLQAVAAVDSFNNKLTQYNTDKKEMIKALKTYLAMKKSTSKAKLDQQVEKVRQLKHSLEILRCDMEATLRQSELSREQSVTHSLNSCYQSYWEFFKAGYELLEPFQSKAEQLSLYSTTQAKVLNEELGVLKTMQKQWETDAASETKQHSDADAKDTTMTTSGTTAIRDLQVHGKRSSSCENAGYLYIPAPNFQRVWCSLKDGVFRLESTLAASRKGEASSRPDCNFPIVLCTAKEQRDSQYLNMFTIIQPSRTLLLQADNAKDVSDWLNAIQNAISNSLNALPTRAGSATGGADDDKNGTPVGQSSLKGTGSGSGGNGGTDRKDVVTIRAPNAPPSLAAVDFNAPGGDEVFTALVAIDGNTQCADCDNVNPQWMSINLGVMMCMDCCGVHRSMGVHISKVKSPTLDKIDHYLLSYMKTVGNTNANNIWCAKFPNKAKSRPHRTSNREMRELWIRSKYEQRKFLKGDGVADESRDECNIRLFKAIADDRPLDALRAIAWGADINWANPSEDHRTPLHQAVSFGNPVMVEMLIQNGATTVPAGREDRLWTPLHYAAYQDDISIVELLLLRGGSSLASERDGENKTPLDTALHYAPQADAPPKCRALLLAAIDQQKEREARRAAKEAAAAPT